jgi:hypothetical protein
MISTETIKENYARMPDGRLVDIAVNDAHNLTPEAFQILKAEFKKRRLDYSYMESAEQTKADMQEEKVRKIKESVGDALSKETWKYIFEEKENGTPDSTIVKGLQQMGVEEQQAVSLLATIQPKLTGLISESDNQMLIGGLCFTVGSLVTFFTYSQAMTGGGTYVITWGAIVFGAIRFFTGISDKGKYKVLLNKIQLQENNSTG